MVRIHSDVLHDIVSHARPILFFHEKLNDEREMQTSLIGSDVNEMTNTK
jgi:hypothetical protein